MACHDRNNSIFDEVVSLLVVVFGKRMTNRQLPTITRLLLGCLFCFLSECVVVVVVVVVVVAKSVGSSSPCGCLVIGSNDREWPQCSSILRWVGGSATKSWLSLGAKPLFRKNNGTKP